MNEESGNLSVSRLSQIVLEGVEEISGRSGVRAALNAAELSNLYQSSNVGSTSMGEFPFNEVSAIGAALGEMYGRRGGRGIALRAGRAAFKYVLRTYGASMNLLDLNFRMLPEPVRINTGLTAMASLFSELGSTQILLEETSDAWLWRMERCPFCWQVKSIEPVCTFMVGMLQEFFTWASGGKVYHIQESECLAMQKSACLIKIDIRPLE